MSRTPVVMITGVADEPMSRTTMGLQWDLPSAVVVQHRIDAVQQVLTRTVSDISGVVEREEIDLEHACVSCAIREDIVPSLERLAASGRWGSVIAHLPVTAEATQVCRLIAWNPDLAPHVTIAGVVTAFDAQNVVDDLLGDDLVADRGLSTSEDDSRGVAEIAAAMVEYGDVVALLGQPDEPARDLVRTIARPGTGIVEDASLMDAARIVDGIHEHRTTEHWVAEVRRGELPVVESSCVWRLDLHSDRPFHPGRLHEHIERIGGGPRRSRGCFWLPSRPGDVCVWDGAGGQLSIGSDRRWERSPQMTRIVVVGLDDGAEEIREVFDHCLLSEPELAGRGPFWEVSHDGLEPWLGDIRRAA
ncbi:CobW family GTP-binding protein [Aeromicrobium sp. CTD01-1L150]|uniref:CobW family GTP-binding protein n=1 Tax=Aeromicrobium sp. CTD01-1L150 TaxID=3341830 RepID=UPI0035C0B65B